MIKENRHSLIDTENILTVARWEELGGWVENLKGLRTTNWWLPTSHSNAKGSIGDTVNNIVISTYGVRWEENLSG